jgi:hypothetical protein
MNKFLLAAIALGLWANAATAIIRPAYAEDDFYMRRTLDNIEGLLRGTLTVHCNNCS